MLEFFILLGRTGPTHARSQNSGDNLHCSLYRTLESSSNEGEEKKEGELRGRGRAERSEGVEEGEERRR